MAMDIIGAFKTGEKATKAAGAFAVALVFVLILVGSIIGAILTANIPLSTGYNTVLSATDSTTSAWFTTIVGVGATIAALVIVVVLVKLFGVMGKKKDGEGNMF